MAMDDITPESPRPQRREEPRQRGHWARTVVVVAVLVGYAWVAGSAAPFTAASFVGVLIPGAVLAGLAVAWPPERIAPPARLDITGVSYWLIAIAALFEWEASAFKDNSLPWHPSLTDLVNPILAPHPVKSAAILIWILVGWGLVRR